MYESLVGKKLLVIGADVNDIEIVKTAQSMGVYTITVDWSTDYTKSPAKNISNEAWDMNYRDIEGLAKRCIEEKVDGIMAGYSETRVLLAAKLSEKLGKPFYATEHLVEITRDKRSFKKLCKKYCVPIPKEYCPDGDPRGLDIEHIHYPVIVKPSDYGGRFGITICENSSQMNEAIEKALLCSENKRIVVEEYVEGEEMASIYHLSDGRIELALVNDKYQVIENGKMTTLCHVSITPSKHLKEYKETVDPYIKEFLKEIGAENGIAFFQMIAGSQGIRVFEMGYRLNGGNDQHITEKNNGINHMKMLISYSLTGNMEDDITKNDPEFDEYAVVSLSYVHGGVVGNVNHSLKIGTDDIIAVTQKVFPGNTIADNYTTQQEGMVVKFLAKNLQEAALKIKKIQESIHIEDQNGNSLLFDRFDTNRLFEERTPYHRSDLGK